MGKTYKKFQKLEESMIEFGNYELQYRILYAIERKKEAALLFAKPKSEYRRHLIKKHISIHNDGRASLHDQPDIWSEWVKNE